MTRMDAGDENGLTSTAGATAGNYLGTSSVVDQLVRDFLSSCISVNEQFQTGVVDGDAAELRLVDLAKRYADIFLGQSKDYKPMPWNSPRRLEFYLRAMKPPHLEDHARATDAFFACHGTAAIMLAMRADKRELTEAEVQEELTKMRNAMVRALLGIAWAEHLQASEAA